MKLKLLIIAGARPNFMKVAPIIKAIGAHNDAVTSQPLALNPQLSSVLLHTGQHYDEKMSEVFFRELGIPAPDINLGIGSGSHAAQTANIMLQFEPVCLEEKPDWVVVVGDVNSTLACTLVASKLGIKVAHVEAGLRSFDRTMPEEVNRIVTDSLAELLLTPSEDANENLRREGVPEQKIRLVGNVMIDTLVANLDKARASRLPGEIGVEKKRFAYVTLHRPSNVDEERSLRKIFAELEALAQTLPVVFPIHPRTRKMCERFRLGLSGCAGLRILEPLGYHDSLWLTENARVVVTDSGGLQEESTYFRTPCLTLRPNTERPITVTVGSNKLTSLETFGTDIGNVLRNGSGRGGTPLLWDGKTAERIVSILASSGRASATEL